MAGALLPSSSSASFDDPKEIERITQIVTEQVRQKRLRELAEVSFQGDTKKRQRKVKERLERIEKLLSDKVTPPTASPEPTLAELKALLLQLQTSSSSSSSSSSEKVTETPEAVLTKIKSLEGLYGTMGAIPEAYINPLRNRYLELLGIPTSTSASSTPSGPSSLPSQTVPPLPSPLISLIGGGGGGISETSTEDYANLFVPTS